jgi:hypothetical protein
MVLGFAHYRGCVCRNGGGDLVCCAPIVLVATIVAVKEYVPVNDNIVTHAASVF